MRNRWLALIVMILIVTILGIVTALTLAPESTGINLLNSENDSLACLMDADAACLLMPGVIGLDVNNAAVHFPERFEADYQLVVMPFDREQQVLAVTWLPLFQELAAEHANVQYWSIAALPALNPAIRLLVIAGISAGISDAEIRTQATLLFLEDQDIFLEALAIDSTEEIQSFILDRNGVIYYRVIGEYSEEKGAALRAALNQLLAS